MTNALTRDEPWEPPLIWRFADIISLSYALYQTITWSSIIHLLTAAAVFAGFRRLTPRDPNTEQTFNGRKKAVLHFRDRVGLEVEATSGARPATRQVA